MLIASVYSDFTVDEARTQRDNSIWSVCFSPDGKYLATGSDDELIRV